MPSVEVVAGRLEKALDGRLRDFDSLDGKAGMVLGFAGVLIALSGRRQSIVATIGLVLAGVAAIGAVAAFAPRRHPDIDPERLSRYVHAEREFTVMHLVDTHVLMVQRSFELLERKDRRLRAAMGCLVVAILLLAVEALIR